MSTDTLIHRAQLDLISLYKGLSDLNSLVSKLPDPTVAAQGMALVTQLRGSLDKLQARIADQDKEHSQTRSLFSISRAINSTLELEALFTLVMDMIIHVTSAERAFLILLDKESGQPTAKAARGIDQASLDSADFRVSRSIIERVASEHIPIVTTNAQEDPRFKDQQSIINFNLRSILCVPLRVKGETIGVIYADNRIKSGVFGSRDRDLLVAFADQAAIAIQNANLFDEQRRHLAQISELKAFQDNIFASITSGVITTDIQDRITTFNRAAERILNCSAQDVLNRPFGEALIFLKDSTQPLLANVKREGETMVGHEVQPSLPARGTATLSVNLSPLREAGSATQLGVAMVVDDLTEKKKLQARDEMFGRYLAPSVIRRLPDDPRELRLGGVRQTLSILFADIRGYSTFSEKIEPEKLVDILNQYLSLAAGAILTEEGTLDKFVGDAVMAFWNAPEEQADHAQRAVRAAWRMRNAILEHHQKVPPEQRLSFGVGLHIGDVVVGNIGTERALNYTIIGDAVNLTKRLQEGAARNQIVLSDALYQHVQTMVTVDELEAIQVKGRSALEKRWDLQYATL